FAVLACIIPTGCTQCEACDAVSYRCSLHPAGPHVPSEDVPAPEAPDGPVPKRPCSSRGETSAPPCSRQAARGPASATRIHFAAARGEPCKCHVRSEAQDDHG